MDRNIVVFRKQKERNERIDSKWRKYCDIPLKSLHAAPGYDIYALDKNGGSKVGREPGIKSRRLMDFAKPEIWERTENLMACYDKTQQCSKLVY